MLEQRDLPALTYGYREDINVFCIFLYHFPPSCLRWPLDAHLGTAFDLTEVYTASEESGAEDSDEDIITDYLSPLDDNGNVDASTDCRSLGSGAGGGGVGGVVASGNGAQKMATSSSGNGSGSIAANAAATAAATTTDGGIIPGNIPSISITQHSPAASKAFYILGKTFYLI